MNRKPEEPEVARCVKEAANHKAVGIDAVCAELLKYGGTGVVRLLTVYFCYLHKLELHPDEWNLANVWPIHKAGDKHNWSNYRNISLLCSIFKLYETFLNNRLMAWAENQGKIALTQGGFRSHRGCIEHVYVFFETLIMRRQKKEPTYACFLDFKKAFPSVDRTCLAAVLHEIGVQGKTWRILRQLYSGRPEEQDTGGGRHHTHLRSRDWPEGGICTLACSIYTIH
jgi:hypothetical protein